MDRNRLVTTITTVTPRSAEAAMVGAGVEQRPVAGGQLQGAKEVLRALPGRVVQRLVALELALEGELAHQRNLGAAVAPHGHDLVEGRRGVTVPGNPILAGSLVPWKVERMPRRRVTEQHPSDPRGDGEVQVPEGLDERPLALDLGVENVV